MKIKCPIVECGHENSPDVMNCQSCGANLQAYIKLRFMPDYLFNQGLSLSQDGHFQQAEQYLQAALLFNSKDVEAMLLLAEVQALQGNNIAATTTFERTMKKNTNDPHLDKIRKELKKVLEKVPDTPPVVRSENPNQPPKRRPKATSTKRKRKKKKRR